MNIIMKTLLAGPGRDTLFPGQLVDLDEVEANELIAGGYAKAPDDDPAPAQEKDSGAKGKKSAGK